MSFSSKLSEGFGKVLEKSPYSVSDQVVKLQYVQRGNNIVFGRTIKNDDYSQLIYLGKIAENCVGKSYLGADAWLDVTFPHVVYITGTRGSGKSFDLGVIVEGLSTLNDNSPVQNNVTPSTSIIIDTQSQFWTLRFPPSENIEANQVQLGDLKQWNFSPNYLSQTRIFVPPKSPKFLGDEIELTVRPSDVTHEEWCGLFGQEVYSAQGHIIGQTLDHLLHTNFAIDDMISYISDPHHWTGIAESSRNAILYKLQDYRRTGLFSRAGVEVTDLLKPGMCSILMLRDLRNEDKALITAIIARQLFTTMGEYHNRLKISEFFGRTNDAERLPNSGVVNYR